MRLLSWSGFWLLAALATLSTAARCQTNIARDVLSAPVNSKTTVRFFFNPGEYYHWPLVFHVVPAGDPRLKTMPMLLEGQIAYITPPGMRLLLNGLSSLSIRWKGTARIVPLGPRFPPPVLVYAMVITVLSSRGTATGEFDPAKICDKLVPLQSSLVRPRARWEFQYFLKTYGCNVPGYDPNAFLFRGQKSVPIPVPQ